jgi:hypothetical protein
MHMNIEGLEPAFFSDLEESAGDCSARGMNQNIEASIMGNGFDYGARTILGDPCIRLNVESPRDICCGRNLPRFG